MIKIVLLERKTETGLLRQKKFNAKRICSSSIKSDDVVAVVAVVVVDVAVVVVVVVVVDVVAFFTDFHLHLDNRVYQRIGQLLTWSTMV